MSNPYEVEHNIKGEAKSHHTRPDMSSFFNQLSQITTESTSSRAHNNPNAVPTPVDVAATARLLQEQFTFLLQSSENENHRAYLENLTELLQEQIEHPPEKVVGVPQSYLDELDRVPKKALKKDDICPICAEKFLDDEYPLVVQLPCHKTHRFDLECVGPWLRLQGTCPLDRKELMKKEVPKVDEEEEDYDDQYA